MREVGVNIVHAVILDAGQDVVILHLEEHGVQLRGITRQLGMGWQRESKGQESDAHRHFGKKSQLFHDSGFERCKLTSKRHSVPLRCFLHIPPF